MAEKTFGIALLGGGVVGGGVARILRSEAKLLQTRTGLRFDIRHVVVRDAGKVREGFNVALSTDANAAIDDPAVQVVVELIGGTGAAFEYVSRALRAGKPVVTANKSLLATRGKELFALARKHNTCIAFEASCGGGIPIIQAITQGLVANRIDALVGIVNGTCNFILTKMTKNGWGYADALAEAQKAGFAEADPTMDVSGRDTAQKLALLASLAFNAQIREEDIHIEGIDSLQKTDIYYAGELGYVIKLLAIAERRPLKDGSENRLSLRVHPTLVHTDDVLAEVSGSFNAVSLYGNSLGHALFYGRGAGQLPTASAVVADLVSVALGITPLAFNNLRVLPDQTSPPLIVPFQDITSRYYLRLLVRDEPGVLAQITTILGKHKISLSAISQHEHTDGQLVPIVITTHHAREGAVQAALSELNALPIIDAPAACLRIIDQPTEFAV